MPFRRLFVTVGWTSTPIAKFSLDPGVTRAQNRAILLMTLSGFLGLSPLITFILISFTFLLLVILRTPHPVFFPCRILSIPPLPGFRCFGWFPPSFLFPISPSWLNLVAQRPDNHGCIFSHPYVFPPFILIPQVLRFVKTHCFPCTIVIPDVRPGKFWWPLF